MRCVGNTDDFLSYLITEKDVSHQEDSSPERSSKGITRMVFNQDTNAFQKRGDLQKRKPRLVTTMPSAATMPKMTAAEIKRRIAQIKFPLMILGRDELSSSIEVSGEIPQFNGLDEHIWPFMVDWTKTSNEQQKDRMYSNNGQQAKRSMPVVASNLRKVNNDVAMVKLKDKKVTYCDTLTKKKVDSKRPDENVTPITTPRKTKPMRQFKDKMLKLLYKKPSVHDMEQCTEPINVEEQISNENNNSPRIAVNAENNIMTTVNVNVDSKVLPQRPENILLTLTKGINDIKSSHNLMGPRHPWARAKWASDFIDNVMRKIKSGAYYSYEGKRTLIEGVNNAVINSNVAKLANKLDASTCVDFYDVAVQTLTSLNDKNRKEPEKNDCQTDFKELVANGFDPLISIPGFDDTLPEFEIKTLNINQIAVKHCLTNVMVQFDVAVPDKSSNLTVDVKPSTSSSCVPLSTTDSLTKIFKCNTTILNAVLPAELCSVIPKVMRSIMDSDSSLTIQTSFTDSHVTISEISECDSIGPLISLCPGNDSDSCVDDIALNMEIVNNQRMYYPPNQYMCSSGNYCVAPVSNKSSLKKADSTNSWVAICPSRLTLYQSRVLTTIMSGRFLSIDVIRRKSISISRDEIIRKIKLTSEYEILPQLCTKAVMCCVMNPIQLRTIECEEIESSNQQLAQTSSCTSLETYKGHNSWSTRLGDFTSLLQNMWDYCKFNIHFSMPYFSYVHPMHLSYDNNNLTVNMIIGDTQGTEKTVTVTVSKLEIDSIYSRFSKKNCLENGVKITRNDALPIKSIDCLQNSRSHKSLKKSQEKPRKRGYVKLYKKCKSTTSLSGERTCTSLSKIVNLDDFFQALGSAKSLSSVFDGCPGHKILSCIGEMKNWIKDITPRQALLVLLLTNKKETSNLVRFRPVLLQGIAVNRITRATELDMEIEVIERENVKLTQYEGISYIPASEVNQDNLLEELCWIAKTTASDYQRPFDETSEKLLKSLLEKRKKLNPSYLRVMARYVGLGLLKTPSKHK
uniref:Uncharacterized protein n=1 Tax=Pectinophora gossypiella TaxID=13191 RepID=A0A1E1WRK7_PECGO